MTANGHRYDRLPGRGLLLVLALALLNPGLSPPRTAAAAPDSTTALADPGARRKALRKAVRGANVTDSLRYAAGVELGLSELVEDRILALELLEAARFSYRGDPEFLRDRAELFKASNQPARARESFEDLLKQRPQDVEARVAIARLRLEELIQHYDLSLTHPMLAELRTALAQVPHHEEALFLSALALELQGSVDGAADVARLREGVELVERLLASDPENAEARFLLAVLRLDLGQKEESARQFDLALNQADAEWQPALLSARWTAPEEAATKLARADQETRDRYARGYWGYHDPTPLTLLNERRLEIVKRLVLAEFLFGNPERGLRGWNSAPGEAFIRYGPPPAHDFEPGQVVATVNRTGHDQIRVQPSALVWRYRFRDLAFSLRFEDVTLNYRYIPSEESAKLLTVLRREVPVVFHEAPPGKIRQIYLASGGTATDGRRIRQSVRLGIPLWRSLEESTWLADTRLEIVVKDSTRTVVRRSQRRATTDDVHRMFGDQGVLLMTSEFELDPGNYTIAAYVEDQNRKIHGVLEVPVSVKNFKQPKGLRISDLELTFDPGEEAPTPAPATSRHGVRSVANPLGLIGDERRLNLFYEIYGLATQGGVSRHEVRYTVVPREYVHEHDRQRLGGSFGSSADREMDDLVERVAAGISIGGFDISEENSLDVVFPEQRSVVSGIGLPRATRVGIPRLVPDEYVLIVTVHDLVVDAVHSERAFFRVLPDDKIRGLLVAAQGGTGVATKP